MNIVRLTMMKDLMEQIQSDADMLDKFDLTSWLSITGNNDEDPKLVQAYIDGLTEATPQCGFTACACGWAGVTPEFNALGLFARADEVYYTNAPKSVVDKAVKISKIQPGFGRESIIYEVVFDVGSVMDQGYEIDESIEAMAKFFDIDDDEAAFLFDPIEYSTEDPDVDLEKYKLEMEFPKEMPLNPPYGVKPKHVAYRVNMLITRGELNSTEEIQQ